MTDLRQLPHLLRLLDDDSPVVRTEVDRALAALAPQLGKVELSPAERETLHVRLLGWRHRHLKEQWANWESADHPLEVAHTLISEFLGGLLETERLGPMLDSLAQEYPGPAEPAPLAEFLFSQRLRGDAVDYYHPHNSSLLHVLKRGRGNPISLCSVFMLVGRRLGLEIHGCNFPSNFLARCGNTFYDCFRQGRALDETGGEPQVREMLERPCSVRDIVARILRNLVGAYQRREEREEANLFGYLWQDLQARREGELRPAWPEPKFAHGQLVRHARYRGVVVHYHLQASAPQYYILVHRASEIVRCEEKELSSDDAGGPVAHPLINYYFSKYQDGVYFRNGRPLEGV